MCGARLRGDKRDRRPLCRTQLFISIGAVVRMVLLPSGRSSRRGQQRELHLLLRRTDRGHRYIHLGSRGRSGFPQRKGCERHSLRCRSRILQLGLRIPLGFPDRLGLHFRGPVLRLECRSTIESRRPCRLTREQGREFLRDIQPRSALPLVCLLRVERRRGL